MRRSARALAAAAAGFSIVLFASFPLAAADKQSRRQPEPEQQQPQGQSVSPKVGKLLTAAQEEMKKENWDAALAQLAEAQALADKTQFDEYQINEFLGYVYAKKGDLAAAGKAFQFGLDSGLTPPDKVLERTRILAQLYFEAKDYQKAIQFGSRWRDAVGNDEPNVNVLVGQSQYLVEDYRNAVTSMKAAIDAATRKGQPVNETWLQVLLSSYVQLQDQTGTYATLQKLAVAYPKKSYWEDLFSVMQRQQGEDERTQLNVLRLAFETGLLKKADDYFQMAQLATRVGVPGEAVKVLEQGNAKKVFTGDIDPERCRQMLQEARVAAAADRKSLIALEKEARASKSGEADVQLGIAFISYDQYDKGVEAIRRGLDKGKLKRPDEAEIMLGKALLKLNRPADAQAAFERVADSSKLSVIADLWRIYSEKPAWLSS